MGHYSSRRHRYLCIAIESAIELGNPSCAESELFAKSGAWAHLVASLVI